MLKPAVIRREIAHHRKIQNHLEKLLALYEGEKQDGKPAAPVRKSSAKRDGIKGREANLTMAHEIMTEIGAPIEAEKLLKKMHAKGSAVETATTLRQYFNADTRFEKAEKRGFWQLKPSV
jgi:hypothetical protein